MSYNDQVARSLKTKAKLSIAVMKAKDHRRSHVIFALQRREQEQARERA